MPRYEITSPSGKRYEITAPEGATQEQVLEYARQNFAQQESSQGAPAPQSGGRTLLEELARQAGLTVRAGVEGVAALPNMVGDAFGLRSTEAVRGLLTKAGLPVPENATERVAQDVAGAMAGMGGVARVAQVASPTSTAGQTVRQLLTERLGTQAASTAAASGAAGTTREAGGGPTAQLAAGLGAGVAVPMAIQAVRQAVPNMVARSVTKSEQAPFGVEGQRLREATGIDLTTGQASGNKLVLGLENTARQYGPVADRVQDVDVKIATQAIRRVEDIADAISSRKLDPATLGTKIEDTVKTAARELDNLRDTRAAADYGRVRDLAGNRPVITLRNFANELRSIVDEFSNVVGADAQKVTSQAKAALARITGQVAPAKAPGAILGQSGTPLVQGAPAATGTIGNTVTEAMRSRSFYGKAARGAANVFDDVAPDMNRSIASRLFRAINKDFDDSTANASGELRKALDVANSNFRKASQSIEFLEKSTLGKLVGEDVVDAALSGAKMSTTAGETIVSRIASAAPSSRKAAIDILENWNPGLAKDLRANVLREALDKAMSIPPSAKGASEVPLSFNRFISAIQGEKTSFENQLRSYGFRPNEITDIKDTVQAMLRAGDRTGYNFSGTNVARENLEIASAIGSGLVGNIKGAATKGLALAGKYIGLSQIVSAMETPAGRQALRTISSPKASIHAIAGAFETIENSPPEEPDLYWTSRGGRRLMDMETAPGKVDPRTVADAARWVLKRAGVSGKIADPEKLSKALEKTAPQLRYAVVEELIRQGRVPAVSQ